MRVAVFSTKPYDKEFLEAANVGHGHDLVYFEPRLDQETAPLAAGFGAIVAFVNDQVSASVLEMLASAGTRLIALRSAGFNNIDLARADALGLKVVRVPAYSPHAVAEHTIGLILALNRKLIRANARVREGNFSLEGLVGFDLYGKTVGIVGTGRIGAVAAQIFHGFGCQLVVYDPVPNPGCIALGARYVPLHDLFARADIVTLHCPLAPETHHLINREALQQMKREVMLINTSRGAILDTRAVIDALKSGHIGYLGLDVYEEEADLFFEDLSNRVLQDDVFARLLTFPNVLITGHQAFFTNEALQAIAMTTIENLTAFERAEPLLNVVLAEQVTR